MTRGSFMSVGSNFAGTGAIKLVNYSARFGGLIDSLLLVTCR
jgi:hypothetical protein